MENYLMSKLSEGLEGSKVPWRNQFQEIQSLVQENLNSSVSAKNSIREKLYSLNNLMNECQMLSSKGTLYTPEKTLALYNIKRSLATIKGELREIRDKLSSNGQINLPQNSEPSSSKEGEISRWTSRSGDGSKVHGFEDEVLSLLKLLLRQGGDDHQFKAIGIVGMAGTGKTTLCQEIFKQEEVKNHFVPRIWVCMPRQPNEDEDPKIAIVKRMLTYLGLEEEIIESISDSQGLPGLLRALYLQLNGKRYLIVFDDAGGKDLWYGELTSCLTRNGNWKERLAYGLPKGYGGAVIVTSRDEETAKMMVGEENLHPLLPLSDPESCWSIFKDSVEKDDIEIDPSVVSDLKMEIIQKCAGLPLAAKIVGQMYHEKRLQEQKGNPEQQLPDSCISIV